jgi:hypothetical protein
VTANGRDSEPDRRATWVWLALSSAVTVLVYFSGLTGGFVWDDRLFFVDNDILPALKPWNLREILLQPTTYWRDQIPVTNFLFVLEYNLFGTSTAGYHAVSLLLYLANGFVAFRLIRTLYREFSAAAPERAAAWPEESLGLDAASSSALVVTTIFMLHPVHVETVAYIVGQKDLLYGLFSLLSILFVYRAARSGRKNLVAAIAFYYLAFLSKNMAVATALFIPAFWLLVIRKRGEDPWRPLLLWVAVNVPVALWLLRTVVQGMSTFGDPLPVADRILRAFNILGAHTLLVVKPHPLNFGYPFDQSPALDLNFFVGAMVVAALLHRMIRRPRSLAALGLLLYVVYLLPVLQVVVEINNAIVYDRYLFVSLLGAAIVFERGLSFARTRWKRAAKPLWSGFAALVVLMAALTAAYVPKFASDVASLKHAYEHFPAWNAPPFGYVYALIEDGQLDLAAELVESEASFDEPAWVRDYFRGWIAVERGESARALAPLSRAFHLCGAAGHFPYPGVPLGRAFMNEGDLARATAALRYVMRGQHQNPLEFYKAKVLLEEIEGNLGP